MNYNTSINTGYLLRICVDACIIMLHRYLFYMRMRGLHRRSGRFEKQKKPWFPGLTLKTLLNYDLYWNKCTLYIKTEALLKHYYMYSTLFIEITRSV
jgi:hypothetical protein